MKSLDCLFCHKPFTPKPKLTKEQIARGGQKYCSRECVRASLKGVKRVHHWKTCLICQKQFDRATVRKEQTNNYCSPECYWQSLNVIRSRTCENCGTTFERRDNEGATAYRNRKTCSSTCRHTLQGKTRTLATTLSVTCAFCNKGIARKRFTVAGKDLVFCNRSCQGQYATKGKQEKAVRTLCGSCGKEFTHRPDWEQVYCSLDCYRKEHVTKKTLPCSNCGKWFEVHSYRYIEGKRYYCSYRCMGEGHRGELHQAWLNGKSYEPYPTAFNNLLKLKIRQRDDFHCQLCGLSEDDNGYNLSIHHIDYDKDNISPLNLICLCRTCHGRTGARREHWPTLLKSILRRIMVCDVNAHQVSAS